jgi:hypothetical protein
MATIPAPAAPSQASIGAFGRLTGVLFNPRPTFEDIARKPSWVAPVVAIILIQFAVIAIFSQRVGWRGLMEKKLDENKQAQQMPADQREAQLGTMVKVAPYFGYGGVLIGFPLVLLVTAGVLLGAFNGTASANLNFKTAWGVTAHAFFPGFVGGLLGILILFLKDPATVDIEHLVATNLGALVPANSAKWLDTLATSMDLFTFWIIALLAIGFSAANPKKLTTGRAAGTVLVLWALVVLVRVGIAAIFS